MNYPKVIGEFDTVKAILTGRSIARFGDGEVKAMEKGVYTRELTKSEDLMRELKDTCTNPHPNCLVGIPTMDPAGTKYEGWRRHIERYTHHFNDETGLTYYSSFITRPDCGAWLETREYYELVIKIWAGKKTVAIVSEPDSKLLSFVRLTNNVAHVPCPMYGAYAQITSIEKNVVAAKPSIALLSAGVTATCLANRLAKHGIQTVDLGSIGGFLLRWHSGKLKPDSYAKERG